MKEETGIDLQKLESVLDAALANETEESLTEFLNEMGKEGWEMCGCDCDDTWNRYYFKREIEE